MNRKIFTKWWFWVIIVIVLFPLIWYFAGYASWWVGNAKLRSENRALEEFYTSVNDDRAKMEEAYKKDFDGGETPQETWDMFVGALKSGDIEQAAKYFVVEKQGEMRNAFKAGAKNGAIGDFLNDVVRIKDGSYYKGNDKKFQYVVVGTEGKWNGVVEFTYDLVLNPYTKIWKIESL